jgi:Putative adhesin
MPAPPAPRSASTIRRGAATLGPPRPRGWSALVAASAAIFIAVALLVGFGWLASRSSHVTTYSLAGPVRHVSLKLSSGDAVIVSSGSSAVEVRRTDRDAFGHHARERRSYRAGTLSVASACPRILLGSCSASYEVAVPETASVDVRTTSGSVRLEGFRGSASVRTGSGRVDAEAYCGFDFSAVSGSGDLHVAAACAPQRLQLHTGSGDAVALVPPGRYRIEASGARHQVSGVTRDPTAPFSLDLQSARGGVTIGGGL